MTHMVVWKHPTTVGRLFTRLTLAALATGALLLHVSGVQAADAESTCQKGRYTAAAKYAGCHQKALGRHFAGFKCFRFVGLQGQLSRCRVDYTNTWVKLQSRANGTGATCDNPRFQDNSDGTLTDRLTGLQWEQKTDDDSVHDMDNVYTWTEGLTVADGTAYASFLATLNGAGCFAGHCDWRLPTISELQTILPEPYPCTTSPCIDQILFGPTAAVGSWSSTTYLNNPSEAWGVTFQTGNALNTSKDALFYFVRAVRGGL